MKIENKLSFIGGFNENYISCLEDVELNLECKMLGLENICDGNSIAYHYESQTRNLDNNKNQKFMFDYTNNLKPFYIKNKEKLDKHIKPINV